jgi:hypothetical protein
MRIGWYRWSLLLTSYFVLLLVSAGTGAAKQKPDNTKKKPAPVHAFVTLDEAVQQKRHGFIQ